MRNRKGFTLIELMIVIAIVGILGAVAIPSYRTHVVKTRRSEGQIALTQLAAGLERYYTQNNTYAGATLGGLGIPATTEGGHYQLAIDSATATAFQIEAVPQDDQATHDTTCGTLATNNLGQKGKLSGGALQVDLDCW